MNRAPSFQFYPADWRKDPGVQALDYFDRGIWFEILCIMFESEQRGRLILNGQRMPDEALARLLGLDNQKITTTLTRLIEYGVAKVEPDTGVIYNKRMVEDERLRKIRQESGSRGGNPSFNKGQRNPYYPVDLDNHKVKHADKQKITPSSSSSSSKNKRILSDPRTSEPFDFFYKAYPKHEGKQPALKAWNKLNPDSSLCAAIIETLEKQKAHKDHLKKSGQFCSEWPLPATWLNGRRWEDEIPVETSKTTPDDYFTKPEVITNEHSGTN